MPVLGIRPEDFGRREILAYLESLMLAPDDADLQAKLENYGRLVQFKIDLAASNQSTVEFDKEVIVSIFEAALSQPAKANLEKKVERCFLYGVSAGYILMQLVGARELGWNETINNAKERLREKFHQRRLQTKTITKVWPLYRPVAHLWAASLTFYDNQASPFFPCPLADLPRFLAAAEQYRVTGEKLKLQRSQGTALNADETWSVPHGLSLPKGWINFAPATSDCSQAE